QVKLAGTAGIRIEELSQERAVVTLRNRYRIQNHIGGVHACAMALAAETATGILMGMNVPDDRLPLCKSMHVDFKKVAKGGLMAVASLSQAQLDSMQKYEKGYTMVEVVVTDDTGKEPIKSELVWAWVPKVRKEQAEKGAPV
ncbi:unnamed protein product, partial [Discosporangium mesarthrocarpum]